jgi:polysaccharide export outer membrane protein
VSYRTDASQAVVLPVSPFALPSLSRLMMVGFAAILLMSLSGCTGSRGGPIPYDVQDFGAPDAPTTLTLEDGYRISPLDTLKVTVFQVADLSGEYEVDLTGHIALPLIGNVKAVGLTTAELDNKLTSALGARYLQSPDVSVGVTASSTRVVTVDGAVNGPGVFPINREITLLQSIALAKGTTESSNPRRVAIFRQIQGQRMAAAFDLVSIRRGQADDPKVFAGDIVVVDGATNKSLYKEIIGALPVLSLFRPF